MSESVESLKAELSRLLMLMTQARASGNQTLADLLAQSAAKYLVRIADASSEQAVQQQQQIQPRNEE